MIKLGWLYLISVLMMAEASATTVHVDCSGASAAPVVGSLEELNARHFAPVRRFCSSAASPATAVLCRWWVVPANRASRLWWAVMAIRRRAGGDRGWQQHAGAVARARGDSFV
jgi:hypothetical protein